MAKSSEIPVGTIVQAAVGAGMLYAGYQFLKKFGLVGDTGQDGGGNTDPLVSDDADVPDLPAPTISREVAQVIAQRIYAAIYGDGSFWTGSAGEDEAALIRAFDACQNDGDVALVIDAYGVRTGGFAFTGPLTLVGAIREYLDVSDIEQINAGFARRGIQLRF